MLPARMLSRLIVVAFALSLSCPATSAQTEAPVTISFADFLRMFAEQPDHVADWEFVIIEEKFGVNLTERIRMAKKQGQLRQEFYPLQGVKGVSNADKGYKLVLILQPGRPGVAFDPQAKVYTQMPDGFKAGPVDVDQLVQKAQEMADKVKVQKVGTATVDGHQATKIRMAIESEGEIFFYFARDLKGLLIRMDGGAGNGSHLTVSNISFDVPDDLFQPPLGYRQVDFHTFMLPLKQRAPTAQQPPGVPQGLPQGIPGPPPSGKTTPPPSAHKDAPAGAASEVDVEPLLLNDPKPSYTEEARRNRIQGIVRARLLVDAIGTVKQVKITAGLPDGLNEEAVKAAYKLRYRPAMKNGKPVARWVNAEMEFTLEEK